MRISHTSRSATGGLRFILNTQEVLEPLKQPKERQHYTYKMPEGAQGLIPEIATMDLERPICVQPIKDLLLKITTANRIYHIKITYKQFNSSNLIIKDTNLFSNNDKHS
ncbi:hypothetical protein K4K57_002976 [Colletotrichum sp. SAR 10_99]|nr:hypothetical protein K4K57_002976 [Colletotrichum sp. SAR 10_99]